MVERSAVNRLVGGSIPLALATLLAWPLVAGLVTGGQTFFRDPLAAIFAVWLGRAV